MTAPTGSSAAPPLYDALEEQHTMSEQNYSDRELLELAAKAVGADYEWDEDHIELLTPISGGSGYWNPLADDGDALRLGAAIGMNLTYRKVVGAPRGEVAVTAHGHHAVEGYEDDYMAATRRAIVRAAAALSKASGA